MEENNINAEQSFIEDKDILQAIVNAVQKYGLKRAAANIGKAYSTLAGELNLNEGGRFAKLGLIDALKLISLTGDVTAITLIAQRYGLEIVVKKQDEHPENITTICAQSTIAFGDFLKKSAENIVSPEAIVRTSLRVREYIRKLEGALLQAIKSAKATIGKHHEEKRKAGV